MSGFKNHFKILKKINQRYRFRSASWDLEIWRKSHSNLKWKQHQTWISDQTWQYFCVDFSGSTIRWQSFDGFHLLMTDLNKSLNLHLTISTLKLLSCSISLKIFGEPDVLSSHKVIVLHRMCVSNSGWNICQTMSAYFKELSLSWGHLNEKIKD